MTHIQSISNYDFRTVEYVPGKKPNKSQIYEAVKRVIGIYQKRNLNVRQINADNEFECIRDEVRPIPSNIVAADQDVGQIERANRTLKERTRCEIARLPYEFYTREMIKGCSSRVSRISTTYLLKTEFLQHHHQQR